LELDATDLASPQIRRVIGQVERLQQASDRLNNPQAGRGAGASGMVRLSRDTQQAAQSVNTFQQILQQAFGVAGGIGISDIIAAIAAGLVNVSAGAVRANASLERMQVTLRAFTRDRGLADAMTAMLRGNADTTPFGTAEVMQAGTQLVPIARTTAALERAVRLAEQLATLAPEQGLGGATFALREAAAGDYLSLQERQNIPRNLINQLKTEGLQGLDLVEEALRRMGVTWGLVEEQGKTFEGRINTMSSALQELGRVAGQPAFEVLSQRLDRANAAMTMGRRPGIASAAGAGGSVLGTVVDSAFGVVETDVSMLMALGQMAEVATRLERQGAASLAGGAQFIGGRFLERVADYFATNEDLQRLGGPLGDAGALLNRFLIDFRHSMMGTETGGFQQVNLDTFDPTHVAGMPGGTARRIMPLRSLNAAEESARQAQAERQSEYLRALHEADQVSDGVLVRNARRVNEIADLWTRAAQQVNAYQDRLNKIGTASGVLDRLLNPLLAYRSLARRQGLFTGATAEQVNAAILDLKTRGVALTREGGLAALQEYLARRYDESLTGSFFSTEQVNLNAQVVNINGQGGQMSSVSGPGVVTSPAAVMRRYEESRGAWPWAVGVAGALR
jgi:hypothetical protein